MDGAVSLELVTRASFGAVLWWHCVLRIADQRVVWVALVLEIADKAVVWVGAMSKTVHFKRGSALYRTVTFALWYGSGLWRIKTAQI